ncbi:MAG: hypothetical protein H7X97_05700 [Opitutaceae bacterium]|nr:hypothetical protein [Verrucomicrobiales bacterium]
MIFKTRSSSSIGPADRRFHIDTGYHPQAGAVLTRFRHFRARISDVKRRGGREYFRALRAAEMAAWEASGGDFLNRRGAI